MEIVEKSVDYVGNAVDCLQNWSSQQNNGEMMKKIGRKVKIFYIFPVDFLPVLGYT